MGGKQKTTLFMMPEKEKGGEQEVRKKEKK